MGSSRQQQPRGPRHLDYGLAALARHLDSLEGTKLRGSFRDELLEAVKRRDRDRLQELIGEVLDDAVTREWLVNFGETLEFQEVWNRDDFTNGFDAGVQGFTVMPPGKPSVQPRPSMLCPQCGRNYYASGKGERCPDDGAVLVESSP